MNLVILYCTWEEYAGTFLLNTRANVIHSQPVVRVNQPTMDTWLVIYCSLGMIRSANQQTFLTVYTLARPETKISRTNLLLSYSIHVLLSMSYSLLRLTRRLSHYTHSLIQIIYNNIPYSLIVSHSDLQMFPGHLLRFRESSSNQRHVWIKVLRHWHVLLDMLINHNWETECFILRHVTIWLLKLDTFSI